MWPARLRRLLAFRSPVLTDVPGERHATWLEIFFDLAFALALISVDDRLGAGPSPRPQAVLTTFGLFILVQWVWVGQVYYDTRYDPDDVPHRLVVLVVMAAAGAIALGVGGAPRTLLLPIGYLVARGAALLLYLRARLSVASARLVTVVYFPGFGAAWLIWLGSLFAPDRVRPALWIAALVIELLTPWVGIRRLERVPVDTSHLPERIGQFVIILLGVTLTNLLDAVPHRPTPPVVAAAGLAFVLPATIWWVYTTYLTARLALPRLRGGQAYGYSHILLSASLLFLGWSLGRVVAQVAAGAPPVAGGLRLLLGGSIVTWMFCGLLLHWVSAGTLSWGRIRITAIGAGAVAVITALVTDPIVLLALLASTLIGYAVAVTRRLARTRAEIEEA